MKHIHTSILHALYYLVESAGYKTGYRFEMEGFGVYSKQLAADLARGRPKPLPRAATTLLARLVKELCSNGLRTRCGYALIIAARLHFIARNLYPPVDDPIAYLLAKYPAADQHVVEYVFKTLRSLKLI